jgi:hypothetical protein
MFPKCSCLWKKFRYSAAQAGVDMVQRVTTVAFEGIEVRPVDVQVQVAPGMPAFAIVGLPDKAVSEARERACARP